jgi:hypothetical protein
MTLYRNKWLNEINNNYVLAIIIFLSIVKFNAVVAQPFVDVLSLENKSHLSAPYDSSNANFSANQVTGLLFLPIVLENKDIILVGADYNRYDIKYDGDSTIKTSLSSFSISLGGVKLLGDGKWSVMFVAIPKISSDFKSVNIKHYQLGGAGLIGYNKSDDFKVKVGLYYNRQFFGNQFVPLLGIEWTINKRVNIYGILPRDLNLEYKISPKFYVGVSYNTIKNTYRLSGDNDEFYVREGDRSFGHMQNKIFINAYVAKNVVLFSSVGYTTGRKMELYKNGKENFSNPVKSNPVYIKAGEDFFFSLGVAFRVRLDDEK